MTRAELLSIGAELLLGETVDTNAAFLGREMAQLGLPLGSVRMVPDDRLTLREAFADARGRAGVVLATGDLTVKKPGGGIAPSRLEELVGRRLRARLAADQTVRDEDLEPA